jgi:hypothetical protein
VSEIKAGIISIVYRLHATLDIDNRKLISLFGWGYILKLAL